MAGVSEIEKMVLQPQAVYQIAKALQGGACEIKIEKGKLVIVKIKREIAYSN